MPDLVRGARGVKMLEQTLALPALNPLNEENLEIGRAQDTNIKHITYVISHHMTSHQIPPYTS
eukprot:2739455-Pyramimonas_sp.AAC.1